MDTTNLVSWLSFDESATADKCGKTWTAYGSPTIGTNGAINGNALQLDGASCIQRNGIITLGGKDFTISGWVTMNSSTTGWGTLFEATTSKGTPQRVEITRYNAADTLRIYANEMWGFYQDVNIPVNTHFHLELDYQHSASKLRIFVDGVLAATVNKSLTAKNFIAVTLGQGTSDKYYWKGTIDEFQIYDGVALHTENFTPPTAEDYQTPWQFALTFDVERKVENAANLWRYFNKGTADTLTISGTTLTALPESQSKTGTAFVQTARQKCFDIPATPEIWLKFDVYFDGSNRWRAYNVGANGANGISSYGSNELDFSANGNWVRETDKPLVANSLQTVLLHMISGSSDGVIEAWVDGDFIYRYTGDVNHGDDFADIYLQTDGSGTFFSNVIISNGEIGLEEGWQIFSFDAERHLRKNFAVTFDVERRVNNVIDLDLTFDVERVIKGKTIYYTVWHKGKPYQIPLTTVPVSPAFATWRQGKDWYNLLVLLDDPRASDIYLRHNGIVYALSLDGESSQGNPPSTPTSIQTPVSFVEHVNKYWLRFDVEDTLDVYDKVADYTTYSRPHSSWTAYGIWASGDSGKYISRGYNFLGIDGMPASVADGFTVDCWAQLDTSEKFGTTPNYATLMNGGGNFIIRQHAQETQAIEFKMGSGSNGFFYSIGTPSPITERFHIAVVVRPPADADAAAEVKLYFNGKRIFKDTTTIKSGGLDGSGDEGYFKLGGVNLAFGSSDYQRQLWRGTIENFRCICGCALWTEDFTPPETFEEYKAQMEAIVPAQPLPEQRTLNAFAPLKIWLTFEYAITSYLTTAINELDFDFCGNRWAVESIDVTVERTHPETAEVTAVSGQALQFVTGALRTCGFVEFGGADFAIDFYGVLYGQSRANAALFYATACSDDYQYFNNGRIFFGHSSGYDFSCAVVDGNGEMHEVTLASLVDRFCHFELDYSHAESALKIFVNGTLTVTLSVTVPREKRFVFLGCNKMNNKTYSLTGAINEFRLFDGITLHSGNFTPPTAEDYAAFKKSYKGGDDVG